MNQITRIEQAAGEVPVEGTAALDDARSFIDRFCAFPDEHCLTAVTLWAAHTHFADVLYSTPRLALISPEAGSGKTRVLEILSLLAHSPMLSVSASPAAIFRSLSKRELTLLFDEVDTIWSRRGKDDNHEDLRALLNAGYKRGATIPRCVGANHDVEQFEVYAPAALAGIGELPDTIMSRSVIIRMRRRAPHERVESYRSRLHDPEGEIIRNKLTAWADDSRETVGETFPELPDGVEDRPAEVWEPLVAVADVAGGDWPRLAREACASLVKVAEDRRVSLGVRLLGDLRVIFGDEPALPTEVILNRLKGEDSPLEDDAPWADLGGSGLQSRRLASLLKPYGVTRKDVKYQGRTLKGYRREHLWDAWERYLPSQESGNGQLGQPEQPEAVSDCSDWDGPVAHKVAEVAQGRPNGPEGATAETRINIGFPPDSRPGRPGCPSPATREACAHCGGEGCAWCDESRIPF